MANVNAPYGFRSIGRTISGGEIELASFVALASYGTAIYIGDVIERNSAANVDRVITPGTTLISGVSMNFGAASTLRAILAIEQPGALFSVQSGATGFAYADLGLNANVKLGTGSATTKKSADIVDDGTTTAPATTNTYDLHVRALLNVPDNAYGAYSRMEVVFNQHRQNSTSVGV